MEAKNLPNASNLDDLQLMGVAADGHGHKINKTQLQEELKTPPKRVTLYSSSVGGTGAVLASPTGTYDQLVWVFKQDRYKSERTSAGMLHVQEIIYSDIYHTHEDKKKVIETTLKIAGSVFQVYAHDVAYEDLNYSDSAVNPPSWHETYRQSVPVNENYFVLQIFGENL